MLLGVVLVVVEDESVMAQKTIAAHRNQLVGGYRCTVIDERVVADRDAGAPPGNELDWYDRAGQADAIAKHHFTFTRDVDFAV